jgi:hypothetical protein
MGAPGRAFGYEQRLDEAEGLAPVQSLVMAALVSGSMACLISPINEFGSRLRHIRPSSV